MRFPLTFSILATVATIMAQPVQAELHDVLIQGFAFSPASLDIQPGDTVRWTNMDAAPHTATADDFSWDTGLLQTNESAEITFSEVGPEPYFCTVHPSMTAELTVVDCDLEVSLSGQPQTIARGERLSFRATASNACESGRQFDEAVLEVTGPPNLNQTLYSGPDRVIGAGGQVGAPVSLNVPGIAPVGFYTVTVAIFLDGTRIADDFFLIEVI